jgi:hypothetical protein
MKLVRILLWANQWRPLNIVPMDTEVHIPFTPQPMDPLGKEFHEPSLEPIHHRPLMFSSHLNIRALGNLVSYDPDTTINAGKYCGTL